MAKRKRKLTGAERWARRERKKKFMMIFVNGKQKRVPRPPTIEGLPVDAHLDCGALPPLLFLDLDRRAFGEPPDMTCP